MAYTSPGDSWRDSQSTTPRTNMSSRNNHRKRHSVGDSNSKSNEMFAPENEREPSDNYDIPEGFIQLDELASASPVQNPHEQPIYRPEFLEERRSQERAFEEAVAAGQVEQEPQQRVETAAERGQYQASKAETEFYTVSYLIFFAIWGTLARLGLDALTAYPGSPVTTTVLWSNLGGSLIMGFLSEDRRLFHEHRQGWNDIARQSQKTEDSEGSQETVGGAENQVVASQDEDPEKLRAELLKSHIAMKKTIPLYIGLTTGFCGSFTSFSSFIRDVFFELANLPPAVTIPDAATTSRNGGYSLMALLSVVIVTVSVCVSGLKFGAHLAITLEKVTPPLPRFLTRKYFDRWAAIFSWGVWIGTVIMAILPPDRQSGTNLNETWRGKVLFAIVYAPLGCLLRFYLSMWMNGIVVAFPLGTFTVNILGTAILGMCWDLQHASLGAAGGSIGGGHLGCQVLEGVQDGFCGCLTTISTWVLELTSLKRHHAYIYGATSVIAGVAILVVIIGSLVWSVGATTASCSV